MTHKYTAAHGGVYEQRPGDQRPRFRCVCSSLAQAELLADKLNKPARALKPKRRYRR